MTSKSLDYKIQQLRQAAPLEVPKAIACAGVIFSMMDGQDAASALSRLKALAGTNWSEVTAIQFMSGRRGLFAADAASAEHQLGLYVAHLIALGVSALPGLPAVEAVRQLKMAEIEAAARELMAQRPPT